MSEKKDILSLDFGSTTGWAFIRNGIIEHSGEADFKLKKGEMEGTNFKNYLNFLSEFSGVDEIFFEKVDFIVNREHAESFMGFETLTKTFCCIHNIPFTWLTVNDWKRELTGSCRVSKKDSNGDPVKDYEKVRMCAALHSRGWKGGEIGTKKRNNECDACGVAFGIFKLRGQQLSFRKLDF